MSYLYPTKSVTIFKIQSKKITVIGEQHLINNYFYQKLNDTWLLWQWIFEQMKKDKALYLEIQPNLSLNFLKTNLNMLDINSINIRDCIHSFDNNRADRLFGTDYRRILQNMPHNWEYMLYDTNSKKTLSFIKILIQKFELIETIIKNILQLNPIPKEMTCNMKAYFKYKISQMKKSLEKTNLTNKEFTDIVQTVQTMYSDYIDLYLIRDILARNHDDIIVLIGNQHALNMKRILQKYILIQNQEFYNHHVPLKNIQ